MTIKKYGDVYIIHCNYCSESVEIESDDSAYMRAELRDAGWRCQKDDNDCWEYVCPVCQRIPGVAKW